MAVPQPQPASQPGLRGGDNLGKQEALPALPMEPPPPLGSVTSALLPGPRQLPRATSALPLGSLETSSALSDGEPAGFQVPNRVALSEGDPLSSAGTGSE